MNGAFLSITSPEGKEQYPLGDEPVTIGRHPQNLIVLRDGQASRFHCVIEKSPRGLLVRDLDSRNGTKVNGQRIRAAYLSAGDVVTIGATEIRLTTPQPAKGKARPESKPATAPEPPAPVEAEPEAEAASMEYDELEILEDLEPAPPPPRTRPASNDGADALVNEFLSEVPSPGQASTIDFGGGSGGKDDERFLPVLAESLPDQPFEYGDISLVNCRGQTVHEAEDSTNPRERKVAGSGDAVRVLRYIILICSRVRATDIHIEPKNEDFALRLRIDGNMVDIVRLSKGMGTRLCALVKILCDIDVQFRNIIQEGHFTAYVPGRRVDFRVSFAPAMFGQKLVIRILDASAAPVHMSDLRLPVWMLDEVQRGVDMDQGMVLVCGPTGSGKTTTLYALLRDCGVERRNVVTIEDPVEIELEGVTQVPVDEEKGNSFPALLRSMLRQDPDVMMIGEIRDGETARIAMQAAMTGHLVFSTVHTKDSIGTVFRLLDLGVEPYLVASSLHIVIAQRLARELCPYCKRSVRPTQDQLRKMGRIGSGVREVFIPVGCPKCLKTGYSGRRGFFEMLVSNEQLREVVLQNPTPKQIEAAMAGTQFTRMYESGYQLVVQGITAFDEIERAVGR